MQRNNISSVGKKSMNEKEKRNNSEPCVCWPKTEQTNSCNIIRQNAIKRTKLNSSKSNEYKVQTSILLHVRVSIGDICIQQYPLNTFLICTTFFVGFRFVPFRLVSIRCDVFSLFLFANTNVFTLSLVVPLCNVVFILFVFK